MARKRFAYASFSNKDDLLVCLKLSVVFLGLGNDQLWRLQ